MNWNRTLSCLLAVLYIALALMLSGVELAFRVVLFAIFPLTCIWYSEAMGRYTGLFGSAYAITRESPGIVVCFMGWVLLLMPIVLVAFFRLSQ